MERPPDDPRPPLKPPRPGEPLPRLVRFNTPEEPEPRPRKDRRKSKGSTTKNKAESEEKQGVLEEQTPLLDTYEARRTIRMIVGGSIAAIVLVGSLIVWLFLRGGGSDQGSEDLGDLAAADPIGSVKAAPAAKEAEARVALGDARDSAMKQDAVQTLKRLDALIAAYPKTAAAREAAEALERARQGVPVFLDAPLVIARAAAPKDEPKPIAEPVVETAPPPPPSAPPLPIGPAPVVLAPPPVTPEAHVATGLPSPRAEVAPLPLPEGFRARPEAGAHLTGWPLEITCDRDGSAMMFVPGGTFIMGRDDGPATERPAHRVKLTPYYIDQHEITSRQYLLFLKANGRKLPTSAVSDSHDDRAPAVSVSAREASDYAKWAGKSLPTEAQWELAARTTDGRPFPWGASPPRWDRPRKPRQIDPVLSFPLDLSPYGVFDLAGNAREWTKDWFDPRYYDQFRSGRPPTDPQGPSPSRSHSSLLTIKGGSPTWETSWRDGMRPEARSSDLGFRCVLSLVAPPPGEAAPGRPAAGGQVPF